MSIDASHARKQIREFLQKSLGKRLSDDDDIFFVGGASSLFAMELVLFIEQRFHLMLDDADLERDNFSTIEAMVRLVRDKSVTKE